MELVEQFDKKKKEYKLRVARVQIIATFNLVDEDGTIIDESAMQPVVMYPGKFLEWKDLLAKLEEKANEQKMDVLQIANRPLL